MDRKELLLKRLDEIGRSLELTGDALALLGLGSIGVERARLDKYSDLDFFVIAKNGKKHRFIENLDWLTNISEAGYYYLNTPDGYKFLYKDGIYCEFAIFEEKDLASAVYSEGKVVWHVSGFDTAKCKPSAPRAPWRPDNLDWAVNEALTCLYVGLCRCARGELLSGTRFIQNYAVDILIACSNRFFSEKDDFKDEFQHERRFERRFPDFARYLPGMIQGYTRNPQSAREILKFIEEHYAVNDVIKTNILSIADEVES